MPSAPIRGPGSCSVPGSSSLGSQAAFAMHIGHLQASGPPGLSSRKGTGHLWGRTTPGECWVSPGTQVPPSRRSRQLSRCYR